MRKDTYRLNLIKSLNSRYKEKILHLLERKNGLFTKRKG